MKDVENFRLMSTEQLMEVNGGGFAYDVGRFIRYLALGGGVAAYVDWVTNDAVNYAVQEASKE
jgi:hypothetical protein